MTTSSNKSPIYWPLLLVTAGFSAVTWLDLDLFVAATRTRIQCGENGTDTEFCAEYPDYCVPRLPQDPYWSGSFYCFDTNYVLEKTAKWGSRITCAATATSFLATPILGAISDTYGRKKVLLLGFVGVMIMLFSNVLAFKVPLSQAYACMLVGAVMFALLGSGFLGVAMSMAADKSDSAVEQRGPAMAALQYAQALSSLVSFALGFIILLQNFTDYTWVFTSFAVASAGFGIFGCFLLEETLPTVAEHEQIEETLPSAAKHEQMSVSKRLSANLMGGLRILYADKLLLGFLPVFLLLSLAYNGLLAIQAVFLMATFQYSQAVASLAGIFMQPFVIAGTYLSTYLMKSMGPLQAYFTGIILAAFGYSIQGVCMCLDNLILKQVAWWFGFFVSGVSLGVQDTAAGTAISMRVKEEHQSKILGIVLQCAGLGAAVGSYIWGDMIFDPAAQGLSAGTCFLWSSTVAFAAGILYRMLLKVTDAQDGEWKSLQSKGSAYGSH